MHLKLPEKLEQFAQNQVQLGYYESVSEFIRDAIRTKMNEARERQLEAFNAAIALGEASLQTGEGIPFTDALMDDLERRAMERVAQGHAVTNPDVLPE